MGNHAPCPVTKVSLEASLLQVNTPGSPSLFMNLYLTLVLISVPLQEVTTLQLLTGILFEIPHQLLIPL